MGLLEKVQNLPEGKRKIILWTVVTITALFLGFFWFNNFQKRIKSFKIEKLKEEINIPSLEKELKNLPKLEIPKENEEAE